MSNEEIKQTILQILTELKPDVNIVETPFLASSGVFDSFDILVLVGNLYEAFDIEIEAEDILPENFESVDAIEKLMSKYQH